MGTDGFKYINVSSESDNTVFLRSVGDLGGDCTYMSLSKMLMLSNTVLYYTHFHTSFALFVLPLAHVQLLVPNCNFLCDHNYPFGSQGWIGKFTFM